MNDDTQTSMEQTAPDDQPEAATTTPAPAWPVLTAHEVRVLGCLIEKAVTTPEYYPLTLNALVNACNQKSNRDPLMQLDEEDVQRALDGLRHTHRLAGLVHTAGSRTEKFRHTLSQVIHVDPAQAAVLCELFLRGPETVGELRTRGSRLHTFADMGEVQASLDALANRPEGPLVVKLPREPGRRESRWMHVLAGLPEASATEPGDTIETAAEGDDLRAEVNQLRADVEALKAAFADFRRQFE